MAKLFPKAHVIGFLSSLILTAAAFSVVTLDLSFGAEMAILLVTAIIQASLQLFLFMHIGESDDRKDLYINIAYAVFVGLVTILGSIFVMVWGW
ncbi:cytochrome aa3 quinol oxidase subunit IV [Bacillus massiliigorillae]|uniref:cytochrome aa3 quinol oxidase subunit IV n=1 Tax=Bacillus massiliigorillae TaxID=1243664 RepID=UPI0003AA8E42|nr:cytochrome aa3 quinol oxidase subunit IV [Bacillus massiliigorillae]